MIFGWFLLPIKYDLPFFKNLTLLLLPQLLNCYQVLSCQLPMMTSRRLLLIIQYFLPPQLTLPLIIKSFKGILEAFSPGLIYLLFYLNNIYNLLYYLKPGSDLKISPLSLIFISFDLIEPPPKNLKNSYLIPRLLLTYISSLLFAIKFLPLIFLPYRKLAPHH